MGLALGEVPDIAFVEDVGLILAVLIDGADEDLPVVDVAPFCLLFIGKPLGDSRAKAFSRRNGLTTLCQCNSLIDPLVRCCWAAAISLLAGRSVTNCSRTQPPFSSLVFESENAHFRFTTLPLSVD